MAESTSTQLDRVLGIDDVVKITGFSRSRIFKFTGLPDDHPLHLPSFQLEPSRTGKRLIWESGLIEWQGRIKAAQNPPRPGRGRRRKTAAPVAA